MTVRSGARGWPQLRLELRQTLPFDRDGFVGSPASADALRDLDTWPNWHGGCLALVGPEGCGKTHLAAAWSVEVGATTLHGPDTLRALDFSPLRGRPVVLEDADRGADETALFHLINMAGEPGGGLLITARTRPATWPAALPDLRSRLNALLVAELRAPDDQALEAALQSMFRERNIKPPEDLIPYLLRRIERSIPKARAIVERLDEIAAAEHRPVSRVLARQILEIDVDEGDAVD